MAISKTADGVAKLLILVHQVEGSSMKGGILRRTAWKVMRDVLSPQMKEALDFVQDYPGVTTTEVMERLGTSQAHAGTLLGRLRDIGVLEDERGYPLKWRLSRWLR